MPTKCAACGATVLPSAVESAICCGADVCPDCWENDRQCADREACQARQQRNAKRAK